MEAAVLRGEEAGHRAGGRGAADAARAGGPPPPPHVPNGDGQPRLGTAHQQQAVAAGVNRAV